MPWQRNVKNAEISATEKGTRFNLRMYVYPDGHGNLDGKGFDYPVNDAEQAMAAFAQLWRNMKLVAAKHQREKA